MTNVLIVANQTLRSDELIAGVLVRNAEGPCAFHVIVPATPLSQQEQALRHSEHPGAVVGESGPVALARMRLAQALKRLSEAGVQATGDVGDPNPLKAIEVAVEHRQVDEILISTLPRRMSRWMAADLCRRAHRRFGLPVTHLETGAKLGAAARQRHAQTSPSPTRAH